MRSMGVPTDFCSSQFDISQPRYRRRGWIGVDLDGTLAKTIRTCVGGPIGEPLQPMLRRVKYWIASGRTVKIFTARAGTPADIAVVKQWCAQHGIPDLEVTDRKDHDMLALWDDRAVSVISDLGIPFLTLSTSRWRQLRHCLHLLFLCCIGHRFKTYEPTESNHRLLNQWLNNLEAPFLPASKGTSAPLDSIPQQPHWHRNSVVPGWQ